MKKKQKRRKQHVLLIIILLIIVIIALKLTTKNLIKKEENNISTELDIKNDINAQKEENNSNKVENNKKNDTILEYSEKQKAIKEEKLKSGNKLSENGLPVLMYHFFYDEQKGGNGKDGNWIEISKFEEQMKYLSENNFYFPTWQEVEDYIDEKQELPEKSIVITVDDGDPSFFELAVPIIQKYDVFATSFIVTNWYGDRAENKEKNISYQSHSNDMHKSGSNGKGVMLSWDYNKIKEDVLTSSEVLGGANIFCYPFGQYNELDIKVLKENNYKLAFTTKGGKVKKASSKYELPRVRISKETGLSEFTKKIE